MAFFVRGLKSVKFIQKHFFNLHIENMKMGSVLYELMNAFKCTLCSQSYNSVILDEG